MSASPFVSRAGIAVFSLFALVSEQTSPGAKLLTGGGAPGSAAYELVDLYDGSSDFFDKFNYYSVSLNHTGRLEGLLRRRSRTIRHMDTSSKQDFLKPWTVHY